jgi:hypothetical protein
MIDYRMKQLAGVIPSRPSVQEARSERHYRNTLLNEGYEVQSDAYLDEVAPWDLIEDRAVENAIEWGPIKYNTYYPASNVEFGLIKGTNGKYYAYNYDSSLYREVQLKRGADPTKQTSYERVAGTSLYDPKEIVGHIKGKEYSGALPSVKKALEKGFFDLTSLDPDAPMSSGHKKSLEHYFARVLYKKGVVYVRDPEGVFMKSLGKAVAQHNLGHESIRDVVVNAMAGKKGAKEALQWFDANYKTKVEPISGKTGKGYRITLTPTIAQIAKHIGFKLSPHAL